MYGLCFYSSLTTRLGWNVEGHGASHSINTTEIFVRLTWGCWWCVLRETRGLNGSRCRWGHGKDTGKPGALFFSSAILLDRTAFSLRMTAALRIGIYLISVAIDDCRIGRFSLGAFHMFRCWIRWQLKKKFRGRYQWSSRLLQQVSASLDCGCPLYDFNVNQLTMLGVAQTKYHKNA